MQPTGPWTTDEQQQKAYPSDAVLLPERVQTPATTRNLHNDPIETLDTIPMTILSPSLDHSGTSLAQPSNIDKSEYIDGIIDEYKQPSSTLETSLSDLDTKRIPATPSLALEESDTYKLAVPSLSEHSPDHTEIDLVETHKTPVLSPTDNKSAEKDPSLDTLDTQKISKVSSSIIAQNSEKDSLASLVSSSSYPASQIKDLSRGKTFALTFLLIILLLHATNVGSAQFLGSKGWASVLGSNAIADKGYLLSGIQANGHPKGTPVSKTTTVVSMTPEHYIDLIVSRMTLEQKLGQMMIVQFVGPSYSLDLSTMINQYNVGAVLIFSVNNNIVDKDQLKNLTQQMQNNSALPLAIAIDQEGGVVDRLLKLDGSRPSAASLGASQNPALAHEAGVQDARDLAAYGINLNLAPVVDVTNVYNPQLDTRTFGSTATQVTTMAGAYLEGLQQSGKVIGTLKHFPGLGDVGVDPHTGVPRLMRSQKELEQIDWAPYRTLIKQGNVQSVMVTHEIVPALDDTQPSSLSQKIVTGILREDLGFQGVIMTDSLTMEGITAYHTQAQAAALSVQAGADLLMGASSPNDVAAMIDGIKQAMRAGDINQQRINSSVKRILMMKYHMGLISVPQS